MVYIYLRWSLYCLQISRVSCASVLFMPICVLVEWGPLLYCRVTVGFRALYSTLKKLRNLRFITFSSSGRWVWCSNTEIHACCDDDYIFTFVAGLIYIIYLHSLQGLICWGNTFQRMRDGEMQFESVPRYVMRCLQIQSAYTVQSRYVSVEVIVGCGGNEHHHPHQQQQQ